MCPSREQVQCMRQSLHLFVLTLQRAEDQRSPLKHGHVAHPFKLPSWTWGFGADSRILGLKTVHTCDRLSLPWRRTLWHGER